jgi:hypothetical protein
MLADRLINEVNPRASGDPLKNLMPNSTQLTC